MVIFATITVFSIAVTLSLIAEKRPNANALTTISGLLLIMALALLGGALYRNQPKPPSRD